MFGICPHCILLAILGMIPFIGIFFHKLHHWYHNKFPHTCNEPGCLQDNCKEKPWSPYDHHDELNHLSEEDAKLLAKEPAPLKVMVPVEIWDDISQEDVAERFGQNVVEQVHKNIQTLHGNVNNIHWYVNNLGHLRVEVDEKNLYFEMMWRDGT